MLGSIELAAIEN